MRVQQVWNWIYQRGATQISAFANISKDTRERARCAFRRRPARSRHRAGVDRRHAQMAAALRRWRGGGMRLHPRCLSRHAVRVVAGRLHAQLPLLLHRHDEAGAQPDARPKSSARSCWRAMRSANGPTARVSLPALPDTDDADDDDGPAWIPGQNQPGSNYTSEGRMLTNIVMMGMGEPLYNFDNVRDALAIVMDGEGLGLSKRRITLSTSRRRADDGARRQPKSASTSPSRCTRQPRKSATRSCRSTRNTASRNC